jgi:hypothetical protein
MPLENAGTIEIPDSAGTCSIMQRSSRRYAACESGAPATAEPVNLASSRRAFGSNDLRLTYRS